MNRARHRAVIVALIGFSLISAMMPAVAAPAIAAVVPRAVAPAAQAAALRPVDQATVLAETAGRLSSYTISARLALPTAASDRPSITGILTLDVVNATPEPLTEVFLRLYPNDPRYGDGQLSLFDLQVAGRPTQPTLSVDDTVARVPLPAALPIGATVALQVRFALSISTTFDLFSSLLNYEPASGTLSLAHWYPLLAGYDPRSGWMLDPVSDTGDLIFADAAFYQVTLTAPASLDLVATGVETATTRQGTDVRHHWVSGPVREFTILADDDYDDVRRDVDGTTITVAYQGGHDAGAARVLEAAVAALPIFNERFGPYPYATLDIVEAQMGSTAGIEYPQIIGLDTEFYANSAIPIEAVNLIVAHEIAHQWWYGLVGNNHYAHAFLDEGLASDAMYLSLERRLGAEAAAQYQVMLATEPYLSLLFAGEDTAVDQPTDDFPNFETYDTIVYGKASLGFAALREEIGDAAYYRALRDYVARHRFTVATPADLLAAFERAAGRALDDFWRHWFEAAEGCADYGDLLNPAGACASSATRRPTME